MTPRYLLNNGLLGIKKKKDIKMAKRGRNGHENNGTQKMDKNCKTENCLKKICEGSRSPSRAVVL